MTTVERHIERLQQLDPNLSLSHAEHVNIIGFENGTVRVALVGFNHVLEIPSIEVKDTIALCKRHGISIMDQSESNAPLSLLSTFRSDYERAYMRMGLRIEHAIRDDGVLLQMPNKMQRYKDQTLVTDDLYSLWLEIEMCIHPAQWVYERQMGDHEHEYALNKLEIIATSKCMRHRIQMSRREDKKAYRGARTIPLCPDMQELILSFLLSRWTQLP